MATGPEHYREAERLLQLADGEYLDDSNDAGQRDQYGSDAEWVAAGMEEGAEAHEASIRTAGLFAAMAQAHSTLALAAANAMQAPVKVAEPSADLTVYRAEHESIVFGLYLTRDAARAHCEAYVRREQPAAVLDWLTDEEDELNPEELVAQVGDQEDATGYVVTPLTVAAAYDPNEDEG